MSLFTPSSTGSFRYGRFNGPLSFLDIVLEEVLLVSCQDIITLNATIIGDTSDHTFFWEQIYGPAVTWLEPQNQLMVMFQKPFTSGDLFFRFWVDRFTQFQQYKDMIVSGTARENVVNAFNINNSALVKTNVIDIAISNTNAYTPANTNTNLYMSPINSTTVFLIPDNFSPTGNYIYNTSNIVMKWTNPTPTYPVVYKRSELYTVLNNVITLVASFNSPINTYQDLSIEQPNKKDTYFFRSYWDMYGTGQFSGYVDSATFKFDGFADFGIGEFVNSYAYNISNSSTTTIFQTQFIELTSIQYTDTPNYDVDISHSSLVTPFQIQILSLINLPDNLQDTPNNAINISNTSRVTIFQTQISGGIINV